MSRLLTVALLAAASGMAAHAAVPAWVTDAAKQVVNASDYDDETNAVILLDERSDDVGSDGTILEHRRMVIRILRPQGREYAKLPVFFHGDSKINSLHAYGVSAKGLALEAKDKDAVEQFVSDGFSVYNDARVKTITAPEADAGSTIAFEWELRNRPYLLEETWEFQSTIPVRLARYEVHLPSGWERNENWTNYAPQKPVQEQGQSATWELHDIPRVAEEHAMPHWNAVAGRLSVHLYGPGMQDRTAKNWDAFGGWYSRLAAGRPAATPQITELAKQLTATAPDFESKVQNIAHWMQREIRYVSIQIGIGGYQPHPAADIFAHRYGDCKDKATLMISLLHEAGIQGEYVVANLTDRSAVIADTPGQYFNHMILAIKLPDGAFQDAPAVFKDKAGQRWLLFDPTDEHLPVGSIEGSMQGGYGVFVNAGHGELVHMPVAKPDRNYANTLAKMKLADDGSIAGEVTLAMMGDPANMYRTVAKEMPPTELKRLFERIINGEFAGGSTVQDIQIENLDRYDAELRVRCKFTASHYAKNVGAMMLVRPRLFGHFERPLDTKERKYPYEFSYVESRKDDVEIELPAGFKVDDMPRPVAVQTDFAKYAAKAEMSGNTLHYTRVLEIDDPEVPTAKIKDLRRLFGTIAMDERASAIFKKAD